MLAVPDQRMEVSIRVAKVLALRVRTSKALGVDAFGGSPSAFHLRPGPDRSRDWSCTQRGSGGESTGGAIVWGAGLEQTVDQRSFLRCLSMGRLKMEPAKTPQQREKEEKEAYEQKEENRESHNDPRRLK